MKTIFFFILISAFAFSCTRQAAPVATKTQDENLVIKNADDDEEYELIIIDPQFRSWFSTHAKPIQFYSKSYYENQNRRYVISWNQLYQTTGGIGPFGNYIDYQFSEDYGMELNYELFWYFRYVEDLYGKRYNFPS